MLLLVADANIEGQVKDLIRFLRHSEWREIVELLQVELRTLADFGLPHNSNDRVVWNVMQQNGAILLTANRNDDGVDSLQTTIRESNTIDSLPVVTISNVDRVYADRNYAARCIDRLTTILVDLDDYRGTGRLYIP